jgi:hypothetical protein
MGHRVNGNASWADFLQSEGSPLFLDTHARITYGVLYMAEPVTITLAAVGMTAITEGIKFLYAQAGELFKWWREKSESGRADTKPKLLDVPAEAFEPAELPKQVDEVAMQELEDQLIGFRREVGDYADGTLKVDLKNEALLKRIDALRVVVEAIINRPLTFQGEKREAGSAPVAEGHAEAENVKGYLTGLVVGDAVLSGVLKGTVKAKTVEEGGRAVGTEIKGPFGGSLGKR